MAGRRTYERDAWEDRFNRPTAGDLRAGLERKPAGLFDSLRSHLQEIEGVTEDFAWRGDCWRWTIEYRTKLSKEPLAIVIPSPQDLQLAVPMDRKFARSLAGRRMKRAVRDGVDLAQDPFDTHWGVWSIQAEGVLEDIVDLVELKLRHVARQVG
jgi:hypothetical protein